MSKYIKFKEFKTLDLENKTFLSLSDISDNELKIFV